MRYARAKAFRNMRTGRHIASNRDSLQRHNQMMAALRKASAEKKEKDPIEPMTIKKVGELLHLGLTDPIV